MPSPLPQHRGIGFALPEQIRFLANLIERLPFRIGQRPFPLFLAQGAELLLMKRLVRSIVTGRRRWTKDSGNANPLVGG